MKARVSEMNSEALLFENKSTTFFNTRVLLFETSIDEAIKEESKTKVRGGSSSSATALSL